jgi:cytochrome c553
VIPIAIVLGTIGGYTAQVSGGGSSTSTIAVGGTGLLFLPPLLMILFRRRYPRWWFDWTQELLRFITRVSSYFALMNDTYPSTEAHQSVHLDIDYPDAENDLHRWLPLVGGATPGGSADLKAVYATPQDVAEGKRVAEASYAGCHGIDGVAKAKDTPHIAGQRPGYLYMEMRVYQAGGRGNTSMSNSVKFLSEEALRAQIVKLRAGNVARHVEADKAND